jgi:hypothetical protein
LVFKSRSLWIRHPIIYLTVGYALATRHLVSFLWYLLALVKTHHLLALVKTHQKYEELVGHFTFEVYIIHLSISIFWSFGDLTHECIYSLPIFSSLFMLLKIFVKYISPVPWQNNLFVKYIRWSHMLLNLIMTFSVLYMPIYHK